MVHAQAPIRPRCLRLALQPLAVATSSCRLSCRRSASSAAALALKSVRTAPLSSPRKARRLPSLKPAASGLRLGVEGNLPGPSEPRASTPKSPGGIIEGRTFDERLRAAGPTASRVRSRVRPKLQPQPQLHDAPLRPVQSPDDQERDLRALAELSEESRLLATVRKKRLRKYEDAFWRSFMTLGREPPARPESATEAAAPDAEPAPKVPEPEAPPSSSPAPKLESSSPGPRLSFHDHLSHYATLGFSATDFADLPTDDALKLARLRLQAEVHPDLPGGDLERSSRINQAYDALSSLDKRKRYQAQGSRASRP